MKNGEYELAQRYLEDAFQKENDCELLFLIAKCMFKLKNYEEALDILNEYKQKTKSLENIEEADNLISQIDNRKETFSNPFAKLFKFLN